MDKPRFARDLFQGTAGYYDRYRLPYPEAMIADLVRCAQASEHSRLLDRALVANRVWRWLRPGGCLALCSSSGPWDGEQDWQRTLAAAVDRWRARLDAEDWVPANWDQPHRYSRTRYAATSPPRSTPTSRPAWARSATMASSPRR